jgi:hypothetical protein
MALIGMVAACAGCALAIAATRSVVIGLVVGVALYFWIWSKGYERLTGGE